MHESEALEYMRQLERRGAYSEAAVFADALPSDELKRSDVALRRARVRMRQGRMNRAREALQAADLTDATPAEQLFHALESASLRIYCDAAINTALEEATAAWSGAGGAQREPADRAGGE